MMKKLLFVLSLVLTASLSFGQTVFADYETISLNFLGWDGSTFNVVANPDQDDDNVSANCVQTNTSDAGGGWAGLYIEPTLGGTIDFTSGTVFTMNVWAPFAGNVLFKLEGPGGAATEISVPVDAADLSMWKTMSFDMASANNSYANDTYDKIVLIFDAGGTTASDQWFFDDIVGPGFTKGTGETVTFSVTDLSGLTSPLARVYDNGTSADYVLYDDGTNGDPVASDMSWTAVASDLTGRSYADAAGVGSFSWELVEAGTAVSDQMDFTLLAGTSAVMNYTYSTVELNNDTVFNMPTALAPVIDGTIDAVWDNFEAYPITKVSLGTFGGASDLSVTVKTTFDAKNIYFLAEIMDDVLSVDNVNIWEKDNFELYFDMNNNDVYEGGDGQKRWIWSDANVDLPGTSAQADVTGGWVIEIAIPFSTLAADFVLTDSATIGFDMGSGDNDGTVRDGVMAWHMEADQGWNTPSVLGTMVFMNVPEVTMTDDGEIVEQSIDGEVITVTVANDEFVDPITPANWTVSNLPDGVTVGSATRVDAHTVTLTLSGEASAALIGDITDVTVDIAGAEFLNYNVIGASVSMGVTIKAFVQPDPVVLPLDFESATADYTWVDFDGGAVTVIANPQSSGINTSATVAQMVKSAGQTWGGGWIALDDPIDFSEHKTFTMKVYSPKVGAKVLLKVENMTNGSIAFEKESETTVANTWEELTFDYSAIDGQDYQKIVIIFELGTMGDGTADFTYLFDDINLVTMLSDDASLSDLQVDAATVTGFAAATMDYTVELAAGTTTVPTVTATATDGNATVAVTPATSLPGTTSVLVTAEDGITTATYTVEFTLAASTDATLSDLQVDGTTVTGFDAGTMAYTVQLPQGTTVVPTVSAVATDANASVAVTPATSLPGTTSVLVTAEDGTTTATYTVEFTLATSIVNAAFNNLEVYGFENTMYVNCDEELMNGNIEVFDITGRRVVNTSIVNERSEFILNESGVYVVRISDAKRDRVYQTKLVMN